MNILAIIGAFALIFLAVAILYVTRAVWLSVLKGVIDVLTE